MSAHFVLPPAAAGVNPQPHARKLAHNPQLDPLL
jgi:hypothetical protein